MSHKRRPLLLFARLGLTFGCATALLAGDSRPPAAQPATGTPGTLPQASRSASVHAIDSEAPPALRTARLAKSSPALSWPVLMRLRWSVLLEELMRASTPTLPEPEVNGTHGLSDDPDPVGSTQEEDDSAGEERDGSKHGWKSQCSQKAGDPFGGKGPATEIKFPLP